MLCPERPATPILARLRQLATYLWALLVPIGVLAAYYLGRRPRQPGVTPVDDALTAARHQVAVANARAAVEIAAVREKNLEERAALFEVLRDADEDRRNERLIEAAKKIRGE